MDLKGKVAIVTGAASGMGRELARQLASAGAMVVATDIDGPALAATTATIPGTQGQVLDVADSVRFRQLVEETASTHGRVDYVFNNAGIAIYGEALDMTRVQWEKIVNVNLWGVINGTTAAYEVMARQGFGQIVNTASAAGLAPIPMMTAYSMTKHAVVGLSTSLRTEAADKGVKVNVVCPGVVSTGIFDHAIGLGINIPKLRGKSPMKEMPVEEAVARILRGVAANEAVIVFPASAKMLDLFARFNRGLREPFLQQAVRQARRLRARHDNA